jgi:hypothetical protein
MITKLMKRPGPNKGLQSHQSMNELIVSSDSAYQPSLYCLRLVYMIFSYSELLGFGIRPSSVILEASKHDVSETEYVSVLRREEGGTMLGPSERANLNHWTTHVRFTTTI